MLYRAEMTSAEGRRHYYGQTARLFKERYYGHHHDLQHAGKSESTSLSTYVWKLREREVEPTVQCLGPKFTQISLTTLEARCVP